MDIGLGFFFGDIGWGSGYLGYRFGIGLFGIWVGYWVIWDISFGLRHLGYEFWDWIIWDVSFGIGLSAI